MAEAAGLALGAVAFASLFSTCIECLDYLSQARTCSRDVRVAVTKLDLLQQRIKVWSKVVSLRDSCEDNALPLNKTLEGGLITDALHIITGIIDTLRALCMKYHENRNCLLSLSPFCDAACSRPCAHGRPLKLVLASVHSSQISIGLSSPCCNSPDCASPHVDLNPLALEDKNSPHPSPSISSLSKLRLKVSWALSDRQKFNGLISDLDFLVSNLERLSDTIPMSVREGKAKVSLRGRRTLDDLFPSGARDAYREHTQPIPSSRQGREAMHRSNRVASQPQMMESTDCVTISRHTTFQAQDQDQDQEISSDVDEGDSSEERNGDFDNNIASKGSTIIVAERRRHIRGNEITGRSVVLLGTGVTERVHLAAIERREEESINSDISDDEVKEDRREERKRTHNKVETKKGRGEKREEDRRKGDTQRDATHKRDRRNKERGKEYSRY